MSLISQPGSDYEIISISLDAGYTRDLILAHRRPRRP